MKKDTLMIIAGVLVLAAVGVVIYNRRKKQPSVSGNAVVRMDMTDDDVVTAPDFSEKKQTEINFVR